MTPEQAAVLADENSPVYIPTAWEVPTSMWLDEDLALGAFRSGDGVAWGDHNPRLSCGSAAFFRNGYRGSLVQSWLPALDGIEDKLHAGGKVADVGCGHGHSTILMAEAFPNSKFWGFDPDHDSIVAARKNAELAGVGDRATFDYGVAKDYPAQNFDLICFFDCLHDMGDPVGAARHAKEALAADGTIMLVEPYANDQVENNINPIGRLYYAASTTLCCAHSLSEEVGLALGAQAGEARLREVFADAGFGTFRRATETPFNLIIEARP